MITAGKKYLSEFTLTPEGTAKLQEFLDTNIDALTNDHKTQSTIAQKNLQILLQEVIPKEILAALKEVFLGTSDHVIAIHGFPETYLENDQYPDPIPNCFYSHHISKALFAVAGAKHIRSIHLEREKGDTKYAGMYIHRDTVRDERYGEYIIFSAPHNAENAVTEVIHLRDAIESIPKEMREKIIVLLEERIKTGPLKIEKIEKYLNLNETLELLDIGPNNLEGHFIKSIKSVSLRDSPEAQLFFDAIERHGITYNIQPGTFLVLNENTMFHRAHKGNINPLPENMKYTRHFLHHAGRPVVENPISIY